MFTRFLISSPAMYILGINILWGFTMVAKVQKWGNSQGLRFPRDVLRKAFIAVGEEVDISVRRGEIVVKPSVRTRGKYLLKDLVAEMPARYRSSEVKWGKSVGRESW
jgi:antitoxin MazE